ncbi:hypothetical protein DICVIV_08760 [Dictyocaulus viviparus]|uniref:Uncharacterized protein n=1 Tax=Dictyocaulus viviparus TaxID=29172 RepID=A0A0D8XN62_DICVI|nr:hypothetical protein DICVIV_08760 [Dictyocaulus viviparus]
MLQTNTFVVVPEVISFHEVSKTVHRRHSEDLKWEEHEMQNIGNVISIAILIEFQMRLNYPTNDKECFNFSLALICLFLTFHFSCLSFCCNLYQTCL